MTAANSARRGIALMLLAMALFALLDTIAKYLARFYPMPGIVWARFAGNFILLVTLLAIRRELHYVRTPRPALQLLRGLLLAAATMLFFLALTVLPLAEATSIAFMMPLFVAVLAVPLLHERLELPRLIAVLIGLVGTLLIVRPGSALFTPYALLPIAMAAMNASYHILTRKVAAFDHPLTSLFYSALVGSLLFMPVIPFAFTPPDSLTHWALLVLVGALATAGHLALISAYTHAPASLLSPFHYSILIWIIILGYVVFDEFPDGVSLIGMSVIVLCGLFIAHRHGRAAGS